MSTLLVPEHLLSETIWIIETGLIQCHPVTLELKQLLEHWCDDKTIYLEELAALEDS